MSDRQRNMESLRKALEDIYCKKPDSEDTSVSKKPDTQIQSNVASAEATPQEPENAISKGIPEDSDDATSSDESVDMTPSPVKKESAKQILNKLLKPKVSMPKAFKFLRKRLTTSESYCLEEVADNNIYCKPVAETQFDSCTFETVAEIHSPPPDIKESAKPEVLYHLKPKIPTQKFNKVPENLDNITKMETVEEATDQTLVVQEEATTSTIPIPPPLPMETPKKMVTLKRKKRVAPKCPEPSTIMEQPEPMEVELTMVETPAKKVDHGTKKLKMPGKFFRIRSKDVKRTSFKNKRRTKTNIYNVTPKPEATSSQEEDPKNGKKIIQFLKKVFKQKHSEE